MGVARCYFFSTSLQYSTTLTVTLPDPRKWFSDKELETGRVRFPVLYVLHGGGEDSTVWLRKTHIEEYCNDLGIISVSIDAMHSCYADMIHGGKYFTYLPKELPDFVEKIFPASSCREDRFIAGFSMGGQGTLKAVFRCPERYAAGMPLSGARDIVSLFEKWATMENGPDMTGASNAVGPIEQARNSVNDLVWRAKEAAAYKDKLPKLFVACATDDYAAPLSHEYHRLLESLGIEHEYYVDEGIHDFYFGDKALHKALYEWLPLRKPMLEKEE